MANYCKRNVIHGLWFSKIQSCSVSTQGAYRSLKPLNLKITFSRPFKVLQLFSFLENRFLGKCCIDIHYVTCFLWLTSVPLTNTPFLNQYGGAVHMSCVVWLVQNSRSHNDKSQMCINAQWFPLPCLHCLLQALSCHLFHFPTFVCVLLFFFLFFPRLPDSSTLPRALFKAVQKQEKLGDSRQSKMYSRIKSSTWGRKNKSWKQSLFFLLLQQITTYSV